MLEGLWAAPGPGAARARAASRNIHTAQPSLAQASLARPKCVVYIKDVRTSRRVHISRISSINHIPPCFEKEAQQRP